MRWRVIDYRDFYDIPRMIVAAKEIMGSVLDLALVPVWIAGMARPLRLATRRQRPFHKRSTPARSELLGDREPASE